MNIWNAWAASSFVLRPQRQHIRVNSSTNTMLYLKLLGAWIICTEGTNACIKSAWIHSNGFSARGCFSLPFLFLLYDFLRPFATAHAGQNESFLCGSLLSFSVYVRLYCLCPILACRSAFCHSLCFCFRNHAGSFGGGEAVMLLVNFTYLPVPLDLVTCTWCISS